MLIFAQKIKTYVYNISLEGNARNYNNSHVQEKDLHNQETRNGEFLTLYSVVTYFFPYECNMYLKG